LLGFYRYESAFSITITCESRHNDVFTWAQMGLVAKIYLAPKRSEPSSRAALIGEQPNPWELLHPQDATSRHRGAEPRRRYGRLGVTSLLSPE